MNRRKLTKLGVPEGEAMKLAIRLVAEAGQKGLKKRVVAKAIMAAVEDPENTRDEDYFAPLAKMLAAKEEVSKQKTIDYSPRPWRKWGGDIGQSAIRQMTNACRLPVAVQGVLMPDAHPGYGLPIGGVLAVENAVIPYAVGSDIACRMCLTVLDLPADDLDTRTEELGHVLEKETLFGGSAGHSKRQDHAVLDSDWSATKFLARLKDKAWHQLGSSGGGNHFVEFGVLSLTRPDLELEKGEYLALLSHSGSRGAGGKIGDHYSRLAMDQHPELPATLKHLAWLDLQSEPGQEYWQAMHLMGEYAQANHEVIHRRILKSLRAKGLVTVENHHNFAWREEHDGKEVIVHRKGAIPAHEGQMGVIPGSMASPGFVVRGRGFAEALCSASHGAGRRMSRGVAKNELGWGEAKRILEQRGVTLLSGSLDETPLAYKDIQDVMAAQTDLVDIVARFQPRIVKMAS